jgi:hypothetical protein
VILFWGYSVLRLPVSCFVDNRKWEVIKEKLMDARKVVRSIARKACQYT